jgi:hypothetical protein
MEARGGFMAGACRGRAAKRRCRAAPLGRGGLPLLPLLLVLLLAQLGAGCGSIGPARLDRDQLDYTRTLAEAGKRRTLFNLVRIRYGEPPSFVSVAQVVSGYTLQGTAQAGLNAYPSIASASDFATLLGTIQYTDRPTFTLTPMTGERFVQAYLRPYSPADVVSLVQGGTPVDVLFQLVAQSVGPLQNTHPLAGPSRSGSPEFPELLGHLRALQEAGVLRVRLHRERDGGAAHAAPAAPSAQAAGGARVFLAFDARHAPAARALVARTYHLLRVDPAARELEVVYGPGRDTASARAREVPMLTRSLLNVLSAAAAEVEVPEEDVRAGRTAATLREPGSPRPAIVVRSGPSEPPAGSYAAVRVADHWYWVDGADYGSKVAFSILELLRSIAEGTHGAAPPTLTIPAG